MSNRTLVVLLGVFVALVAAATAPMWWPNGQDDQGAATAELGLDAFTQQGTTEVTITQPRQPARVLSNANGTWTIRGGNVPKERVDELFAALEQAGDAEVVSRNADNHGRYDVTRAKGIVLELKQGGSQATFIIGSAGSTPLTYHVVRTGRDEVFEARGDLPRIVQQDLEAWRAPIGSSAASRG